MSKARYEIVLEAQDGDGVVSLRMALKVLLRRYGLKAISIKLVCRDTQPTGTDRAPLQPSHTFLIDD